MKSADKLFLGLAVCVFVLIGWVVYLEKVYPQ